MLLLALEEGGVDVCCYNWSRLCENALCGLEEQPGGRWQNSICSPQTLLGMLLCSPETVGTEEVSAYMAGHCVSGTDTVPNLCLPELERISQLQTCFLSQGNKGSCYKDTIRERLRSVKSVPIPMCALVVFHEPGLTAVMDICIILFQKQMELRALPVLP